ncbi:23S rRNA (guanosine(2251)-2'-O)-methyltransferase RlmB [Leptospira gomenensis]|uniref:23S rRNA (Guanosine(2251)-2'-O)-methyltransferase RlmB n=1 Tax=Leptospira gomenensis TaxID=2484974 RepID=A0A5F1YEB2_9LEPT|nr:23S rRNA (guanosine(2251)-2'-O)-methyltransferase RlmB [Leptospira gomenensis]TGK37486.1 23S rRNA (guanosine(2251)-2'-O)-methyltransferase RlmB [Leptospira gomenensis]TGK39508.1 23S rRNA (guanosine(2251)-2'-O)-methyltransferase RlmB [Leptospira gomenensis]TGK43071.1 23S rRNA (guanosine(2251)-2'-O)-methyltransferase RlmB [Leptospira gomenensis]TGK54335.1 23S rRNA (guanosine(2251)-2'-O)-methyltransferase RlmB [Leptospira gomenensis]
MEAKIARQEYIFGKRTLIELTEAFQGKEHAFPFAELYVKENPGSEIVEKILNRLPSFVKVHKVTVAKLDSLVPGRNHQGLVALKTPSSRNVVDKKNLEEYLSGKPGSFLILDRIQDPGNLGNILRTAECFGFKNVILPERESAGITPVVEKVSSGALSFLKIFTVKNLANTLELLKENGYWIVSTSDRGTEDWSKLPSPNELAVLMGNEGEGVKRILLEKSDFILRIPMHGNLSSLNVTVATGVVLDRIVNRS